MLIKKPTVSHNDRLKLVEAYRQLFSNILSDEVQNNFRRIGGAICSSAVVTNNEAHEEGLIRDDQLGSVSLMSPMELGLNFEILLQAAYELGRNEAHGEPSDRMDIHAAHSHLRAGGKVRLDDWEEGAYIKIVNGEFYDENDAAFVLSPWMLDGDHFIQC